MEFLALMPNCWIIDVDAEVANESKLNLSWTETLRKSSIEDDRRWSFEKSQT